MMTPEHSKLLDDVFHRMSAETHYTVVWTPHGDRPQVHTMKQRMLNSEGFRMAVTEFLAKMTRVE